eukprot:m.170086 g.170086  ORF g.170086 m.170086 type:complete len:80 (+) comp39029_c2_seq8:691-930(+)
MFGRAFSPLAVTLTPPLPGLSPRCRFVAALPLFRDVSGSTPQIALYGFSLTRHGYNASNRTPILASVVRFFKPRCFKSS